VVISLVRALFVAVRKRLRGDHHLPESYLAQRAIHEIKRRAIQEMLATARARRYDDVIEGSAVELPPRRLRGQ
jgi:hypothetical protein